MIHVAYRLWGGDGFFAKMLGTSMLSMFENTKEKVTVHIMHNDRLTPDNYGKFCYIAGQYNQQVDFRNVEEISGSTLRKFEEAYPIKSGINAAWYPLITHEVFPDLDKLIFLGADTVFNTDIGELWAYDLGKYGIGAVPEISNKLPEDYFNLIVEGYVKHEDYFNVDVMLLKPAFFKDNFDVILDGLKLMNKERVASNNKRCLECEQDTLNYLYSKNYLKLAGKFNVIMRWKREFEPKESLHIEKAVYHFADPTAKPSLDTDDIYNRLYLEYFLKTPWATVDMFGNINKALDKTFRQFQNISRTTLLHLTNLLTERKRAFFVGDNLRIPAKEIFRIKNGESLIYSPPGEEKLVRELTASKGKKIFFLFLKNYWPTRMSLVNQGFVEGMDFVNGFMFLSERYGFKFSFDTKPIVQEM